MGGPRDPADFHDGHRMNGSASSNGHHSFLFDDEPILLHQNDGDLEASDLALVSSSGEFKEYQQPSSAARGNTAVKGHVGSLPRESAYPNQDDTDLDETNLASSSSPVSVSLPVPVCLDDIYPPPNSLEQRRDAFFRFFESPVMRKVSAVVLVFVIADGALFFFLLMGWHRLCRPRRDCEPRNEVYNLSIQFLNILFTYTALTATPWRVANFLHLVGVSCPHRSNAVGCNLYGHPDPHTDVWFHIARSKRLGITIVLLCNAMFQFINHGTRIVHYNYEKQDTYPGNVWTSVFFAASFLCAGIGASWLLLEASRVRQANPGKFGLGPLDTLSFHWNEVRKRRRHGNDDGAKGHSKNTVENGQ